MQEPQYHLEHVLHARTETLEDFDGPLDVILLLLSKNKIEIQDISITSILEQYLAYLEEMKRMDMEIASEFIAMASHLMLIKTKMLLSYSEQQEALSEMEILIRSLEERQRQEALSTIRSAIPFLEEHNGIGAGCFTKEPEPPKREKTYRYRHAPEDLLRAMELMADRAERMLPPPTSNFMGIVGREPYPVTKKAAELLRRLLVSGTQKLCKLFAGSKTRSEIVATFLALLELCKQESVRLEQTPTGEETVSFLKMPDEEEEA